MNKEKNNISEIKRHYILGIGRSGTTLLMNILNRSKLVLAPPESVFIQFFHKSYKDKTSFSNEDIKAILNFIKVYEKLQPFIIWNYNYNYFDKLSYPLYVNFDELINIILLQFTSLEKKVDQVNVLIEKNPGNSLFGEALFDLNPKSKAIIMIRDYRANILSRKEKKHWRSSNLSYNAVRWLKFNKALFNLNKKYPERTLIIKYEDLVMNGEATLKTITSFLNVPFSLEMLEAKPILKESKTEDYNYLNKSVQGILKSKIEAINKPLYKNRIDDWKTRLSSVEIEKCDTICSRLGEKLDYYPEKRVTLLQRLNIYNFQYLKGVLSIVKSKILFNLPFKIKLWRLNQVVNKVVNTKVNK